MAALLLSAAGAATGGAAVAEITIAPWWRRRLAYAFRFSGVEDEPAQ